MTNIKNFLSGIEDLCISYHLPRYHILCQRSYGIETIIKFLLEPFFSLSDSKSKTCFNLAINLAASISVLWVWICIFLATFFREIHLIKLKRSDSESFFDLAENCGTSSLWFGDHPYTSILCASKLVWVVMTATIRQKKGSNRGVESV